MTHMNIIWPKKVPWISSEDLPQKAADGRENMLCLDLQKTKGHPLGHRVHPESAKDTYGCEGKP
jgi:hypothetical protein